MAAQTHTLRKKIRNAIRKGDKIDQAIEVMLALATNTAEEYTKGDVPPSVMRACAKDLVEFGLTVEKELAEEKNKNKGITETEEEEEIPSGNVSYIQTKI